MASLSLAIRFSLEVAAVVSLAYWGYRTPSGMPAKVALAVAAPVAVVLVWGMVVAPGASNPLSQTTRMLIGSALLLVAAAALAVAGRTGLGAVLALLVVVDTAALLLSPRVSS